MNLYILSIAEVILIFGTIPLILATDSQQQEDAVIEGVQAEIEFLKNCKSMAKSDSIAVKISAESLGSNRFTSSGQYLKISITR